MIVKLLVNDEQSYEPSISIQGVIYGGHIPKYDKYLQRFRAYLVYIYMEFFWLCLKFCS